MEYFSIVKDSDIFETPLPEPKEYTLRPTVKGIVLDNDGKIAMLRGLTKLRHSLFPGGGIEENESSEEAFIRECKEEIGCDVQVISFLGKALYIRSKDAKKCELDFFVGKVMVEKGKPSTTQEHELDLVVDWLSGEEVMSRLESQVHIVNDSLYISHFEYRAHLAAFNEYLKLQK